MHRWAVSTVITRQNKIPSTTGEPTLALIPMWDMCNHCHGTVGLISHFLTFALNEIKRVSKEKNCGLFSNSIT